MFYNNLIAQKNYQLRRESSATVYTVLKFNWFCLNQLNENYKVLHTIIFPETYKNKHIC